MDVSIWIMIFDAYFEMCDGYERRSVYFIVLHCISKTSIVKPH